MISACNRIQSWYSGSQYSYECWLKYYIKGMGRIFLELAATNEIHN